MSESVMNGFAITREIAIDAAHRVPDHASKCKSLHGHRYIIEACCVGGLADEGEQRGMVLDFGFLKEEMIEIIHDPCDHGTILCHDDEFLDAFVINRADMRVNFNARRWWAGQGTFGKMLVLDAVPTAENLAKHWFTRLTPRVSRRSEGRALLLNLTVWETPNCRATYPANA